MILLHAGAPLSDHDLWRGWSAPPVEVVMLVVTGACYARGVWRLWTRGGVGRAISQRRVACFAAGMLSLVIALLSPLDVAADALFSAHMTQHLVLILAAAPLLVAGAPVLAFAAALPRSFVHALARWWNRRRVLRAFAHGLTGPAAAFALHFLALWFWHLPSPYSAALRVPALHALEHLSFLGSACLLWWVVAPAHGRQRASDGESIAVIVGTLMHGGVLGALITFADHPWYAVHVSAAAHYGLSPLEDQQLAGLIMWIPSAAIYVVTAASLLLRWYRRDERRLLTGTRMIATLSNGALK